MRRLIGALVLVAGLLTLGTLALPWLPARSSAQGPVDVRGDWGGDYTTTIGVFHDTVSFLTEDFTTGEVTGTANEGTYSTAGTVKGNAIEFELRQLSGGYVAFSKGTVSADGSTISGDLTSDTNGTTGTFLLLRTSGPPGPAASAASTAPAPTLTHPPGAASAPPVAGGPTDGGGASGQPTSPAPLEYVLPGPFQLSWAPVDVERSAGIVAFVMLLLGAPTPIFNSTLAANRRLIERWARRRLPGWLRWIVPRGAGAGEPSAIERWTFALAHSWAGLVMYLLLTALVYAFLDSAFPTTDAGRIYLVTIIGIAIATAVSQVPGERYVRQRYGSPGRIDVALWTIVLAAACVVITRLTGFQPGYIYGIIGGFTFTLALTRPDLGRMALRGMQVLLAVGVAAWFLRIPFQPVGGLVGGAVGEITGQVLAGVFISAVQGAAIALIPLRFLDGHRIFEGHRLGWAVLWAISIFLFAHVLLYPVSSFAPDPSATGPVTVLLAVSVYAAVALGFWWFFRQRGIRHDRRHARLSATAAPTEPAATGPAPTDPPAI